ncbi:subtilase [Plectosphaerella plurivora]|uniref:Subtilase n=1 Tax=Plectosphaerella plurivora TaxID=936078 RepID=A0A9P8VKB5_9PEZI|nr:subtilase [Plectosphaerella plurivora]
MEHARLNLYHQTWLIRSVINMSWLRRLALPVLLAGAALPVLADDTVPQGVTQEPLPNTYIVELEDGETTKAYLEALRAEPGVDEVTERFAYSPSLFNAVSFEVKGSLTSTPDSLRRRMEDLPELRVRHIWPVEAVPAPTYPGEVFSVDSLAPNARRAAAEAFPPHEMIQVDKLHDLGYAGNSTRIGVVDSGVDWRHPALGGCFGPGCLIEYGYDLVGENYNGDPTTLSPDEDPYEQCNGHGTLVSGVIAAQHNQLGFIGAAPGVRLGVYRTFSCAGASSTDVMIAAIIRAAEDGSDIITMSVGHHSGWAGTPLAAAMSRVSKLTGIPCVAAAGNTDGGGYGVFSAAAPSSGEGVLSIGSVQSTRTPTFGPDGVTYVPSDSGGFVSGFSLWGPTHEGHFKPQFCAPGGQILTTAPGGYTVTSGTSFAAPITAASIALLFDVRGKMSPAEVENILAITSKPVPYGGGDGNEPVAHQGAGMIQVLDAAYSTTRISTSGLSFNDTEFLVPEHEFTISNNGDAPVFYELTHLEALSAEAVWPANGYRRSEPEYLPQVSSLKIEPSSITIQPGAKAAVRVSVTPPEGVNAAGLPVYGGFVSIKATTGDEVAALSVPYLGVAAVMREHHVLAIPEQFYFWREDDPIMLALPDNVVFQLPVPVAHPDWARDPVLDADNYIPPGILPAWNFWVRSGSRTVRYEVFSIAPSCRGPKPVVYENVNGDETLGNFAGFPRHFEDMRGKWFTWTGQLADGTYAPPGKYGVRLYALRHFGDYNNPADWSVNEHPQHFGLSYVEV